MYLRCKLDEILKDKNNMSIREAEKLTGLNFETLRKLYNNDAMQWHRDTLAQLMTGLNISDISDLIEIVEGDRPATSAEKKKKDRA